MEISDIESMQIFNVRDISEEKDGSALAMEVLVQHDGVISWFFKAKKNQYGLHWWRTFDSDGLNDAVGAWILENIENVRSNPTKQAEWLLKLVRTNGNHWAPGNSALVVAVTDEKRGAVDGCNYYLQVPGKKKIPFNTAEEYVALMEHAGSAFAAPLQAAAIRRALGEQNTARPSTTRKM